MLHIRFHGRGGQGMKTASRILGTAFFLEGYEVQDAPRYGAERRGAPIFAYVRASHTPIFERGIIHTPDLVIVADDTLVPIPAAGILAGVSEHTVLLLATKETAETWQHRLHFPGRILTLPRFELETSVENPYLGVACAGAGARLTGKISAAALEQAIQQELHALSNEVIHQNLTSAQKAFDAMAATEGIVSEAPEQTLEAYPKCDWINLPFEIAKISAPAIHAAATSQAVKTGLWRTMRPVIDYDHCKLCWWICSSFCPDNAITVTPEGRPVIDYAHCKGCLICAAQCPAHANQPVPEVIAQELENKGETP